MTGPGTGPAIGPATGPATGPGIAAVLTDIEGTTSSVSFVYERLFPYARQHLALFLAEHGQEARVREQIQATSVLAGRALDDAQAAEVLLGWMDEDRKLAPLKSIQGMIWEAGYASGVLRGHVYPDAASRLAQWHAAGLKLYVYSSGSEQAQRLIFGYSEAGDLRPLFDGYFDTRVGPKREPGSYLAIAAAIGRSPQEVLFLSDTEAELDAARGAGMATCLLVRDGSGGSGAHQEAQGFDAIDPLAWVWGPPD